MRVFGWFLSISLLIATSIHAQGYHSLTGVYAIKVGSKLRPDLGSLEILQLPDHKIKFHLSLSRGAPDYNEGESEDIVELNGNDAIDSIVYDHLCVLHFHSGGKSVEVDVEGTEECGWGYGVTADGTYLKASTQKPSFSYGRPDYEVIAKKCFFYEDSLLTKPKKSYLLKGDKLVDLTHSLTRVRDQDNPTIGLYTEIYNKIISR